MQIEPYIARKILMHTKGTLKANHWEAHAVVLRVHSASKWSEIATAA